MPKKIIIGFQADQDFKEKAINAARNFKVDGIPYPMKLSGFCRIAVERLLHDIMKKEAEERGKKDVS